MTEHQGRHRFPPTTVQGMAIRSRTLQQVRLRKPTAHAITTLRTLPVIYWDREFHAFVRITKERNGTRREYL